MPSLRRSFSSPSVRSSPYPSSSSSSSSARTRLAPHPHSRRSASATAERRVLADIEWWRVHDGQCDLDIQDQVHDDVRALDGDVPLGGIVTLSAGGSSMEPQTPFLHSLSLDSMQSVHPNAFHVLSIAPYSPDRRSQNSGQSTPEISTPLETNQLGLANQISCPFAPYPPSLMRAGGRQVHPSFGLRSVSAPGLVSCQGTLEPPDFADMGGDSFSFNQNLFR